MFYYTYVLQSQKDGRFYTGYTVNLRKRLNEHNSNLSRYTKNRAPFRLIYFQECLNQTPEGH